ncbi:heterokaryon incompatibility protein-domain-containing protein [Apiospora phragmitis]|uniref:Heterokaryon incompatibility protein-domain-containing protein n=1 Tax=Apiospora phragmitis TaxID=2905665 RepID=A0ABR1UR63_9PEZI
MNIESLMAKVMYYDKPKFSCDLCSSFGRDVGTFHCVFDGNETKGGAAANKREDNTPPAPVALGYYNNARPEPMIRHPFPYVFTRQPGAAAGFIRGCMARDAAAAAAELHYNDNKPLKTTTPISQHPARLLDVFPDGVKSHWSERSPVRLVSSESESWSESTSSPHPQTFNSRLRGILHGILPPSFQDAVTITRPLGIRYLWVDALCIIQDSKEDWATESVKMASIYRHAFLTIAADNSPDRFGGIRRRGGLNCFTEITNMLSTGEESTLLIYRPPLNLDRPSAPEDSILSTRGWTFQENILSPRTIHFTATQMVWESRGAFTTEDGLPFVREFGGDKLEVRSIGPVAARRLAAQTGARYLAGLWAHILATDLGWYHTSYLDPGPRHEPPRKPTWSWTSRDIPVAWKSAEPVFPAIRPDEVDDATRVYRSGIRLVESLVLQDVELECLDGSDNPFGPIISDKLHVTCSKGKCGLVQNTFPWGGRCVVLPSDGGSPLAAEHKAIMDYDDSPGPVEYVILATYLY